MSFGNSDLLNFHAWWYELMQAESDFTDIPYYHIGNFQQDTRTYELCHGHQILAMVPAHYRNGLRFLNHIIICFQQLLQHPWLQHQSQHHDLLQVKSKAFQCELMLLSKIRNEFIQEVNAEYRHTWNAPWISRTLNSFLACMYYCGSLNPDHTSNIMNASVGDPQTYSEFSKCLFQCFVIFYSYAL